MAIFLGFALALLATAGAWVAAAALPVSDFKMLWGTCESDGVELLACSAAATRIGLISTATLAVAAVLALVATLVLHRRRRSTVCLGPDIEIDPALSWTVLTAGMLIVLGHHLAWHYGTARIGRDTEVADYITFISLESLAWPFLLQILVLERRHGMRLQILAVLVAMMALSPFRAELMAILAFGLVLPLAGEWWPLRAEGWPRRRLVRAAAWGGMALALAVCAVWSGLGRTDGNDILTQAEIQPLGVALSAEWDVSLAPPLLPLSEEPRPLKFTMERQAPGYPEKQVLPPPLERPATGLHSLLQRLAAPVYQAASLDRRGGDELPTLMDEIRSKFRLGGAPTLNQFLFHRLMPHGDAGQTTTLYYGEAAAYFAAHPVLWMIVAPFGLFLVWLALRAAGFDAQTLFGVALWRSSLAGAITILPSLAIQLLAFVGLKALNRRFVTMDRRLIYSDRRKARFLFLAVAALLLTAECVTAWNSTARNSLWRVALAAPRRDCFFEKLEPNMTVVDEALARRGLNVRSDIGENGLLFYRDQPILILIDVPDGGHASALRDDVRTAFLPFVSCTRKFFDTPPVIIADWRVPTRTTLPLEAFAIGLLAASLLLVARDNVRRIAPHS